MKRTTIYTIVFMLLLAAGINMQAQDVRIGLQLNPAVSILNIESDEIEKAGGRLHLEYGILADFVFNDSRRYALTVGVMFNNPGGAYEQLDSVGNNLKTKIRMGYVNIPLSIKLKTNEFGYFTPFAQLGITPSIAYRSRRTIEESDIENEKAKAFTQPFNTFLNFGAGTEYAIGEDTSLFASFHVERGLMNFVTDNDGQAIRMGNIALRFGIYF